MMINSREMDQETAALLEAEKQNLLRNNESLISSGYSSGAGDRSVKSYQQSPGRPSKFHEHHSDRVPVTITWNSISYTLETKTGPLWRRHVETKEYERRSFFIFIFVQVILDTNPPKNSF